MIFNFKIFISLILLLNFLNLQAQHLVGVKRNAVAQNYKLTSNSNQRFQGYTQKQIDQEETKNKKEQEKAKKELLKSHIAKQSKAVQKRMKANLKMANKRAKHKQISPKWIVNFKRRKILSQRKENKYDE